MTDKRTLQDKHTVQGTGQQNDIDQNEMSFFDKPKNVSIILYSFYALCIILVALDFVVHRHIYVDFEKIPTFYALYGFVACVLLVVLAKLMRLVLMRDETYYDKRDDEAHMSEPDPHAPSNHSSEDQSAGEKA